MNTEANKKQRFYRLAMPNRRLSYPKIVQFESNVKNELAYFCHCRNTLCNIMPKVGIINENEKPMKYKDCLTALYSPPNTCTALDI